jgi:hypothetical protein
MNAWKIPFVTGIRTSGQNLKVRSSRRLKHPDFYALHRGAVQDPHRAHDADPLGYPKMTTGIVNMIRPDGTQTRA